MSQRCTRISQSCCLFIVSNWILAEEGDSCDTACGRLNKKCNTDQRSMLQSKESVTAVASQFGISCSKASGYSGNGMPPYIMAPNTKYGTDHPGWSDSTGSCYYLDNRSSRYKSNCDHNPNCSNFVSRLICYCE